MIRFIIKECIIVMRVNGTKAQCIMTPRIIFTKHALHRLRERGISRDVAVLTIIDPDEVISVKYNRLAARKHEPSCYNVVVIYETSENNIIVITVIKVSERVEKNWLH